MRPLGTVPRPRAVVTVRSVLRSGDALLRGRGLGLALLAALIALRVIDPAPIERLRFQDFRSRPFSTRFWTCLWTVATEERPKRLAVSSSTDSTTRRAASAVPWIWSSSCRYSGGGFLGTSSSTASRERRFDARWASASS